MEDTEVPAVPPSRLSNGVVVSMLTIVFIASVLLATYMCFRLQYTMWVSLYLRFGLPVAEDQTTTTTTVPTQSSSSMDVHAPNTLMPRVLYSSEKTEKESSMCSICLTDYTHNVDLVRVMTRCSHIFHAHCVDPWLSTRSSCPVCRVSPFPL